ncbi:MAG: hypothetical protein ACRD2F_10675, partial [Terriglobales bacterium]
MPGAAAPRRAGKEARVLQRVRVFYHDKCFDGAAAAAVFTAFYRARRDRDARFEYCGLVHKATGLFDGA